MEHFAEGGKVLLEILKQYGIWGAIAILFFWKFSENINAISTAWNETRKTNADIKDRQKRTDLEIAAKKSRLSNSAARRRTQGERTPKPAKRKETGQ